MRIVTVTILAVGCAMPLPSLHADNTDEDDMIFVDDFAVSPRWMLRAMICRSVHKTGQESPHPAGDGVSQLRQLGRHRFAHPLESRSVPDDRDDLSALGEHLSRLPDIQYSGSAPQPCLLPP